MSKNANLSNFHIVKRGNQPLWKMTVYYVIAIIVALAIGAMLLSFMNINVGAYYKNMLTMGIFESAFPYKNFESLIKLFVPLVIVSLALSLAYKMRFWNVGGEGQFIMGAIAATYVAILCGNLPTGILLILMALTAGIAAGIWGIIAAALKVKFGTNETLMTLMLNYVALYILKYFGLNKTSWNIFLREDSERPVFRVIPENAFMPSIKIGNFSLNISLIFAVLFVIFMFVYLNKTKHGYEISVVGDSINTASYAGMKVNKIILRTIFFSAFMIGVASSLHVSTSHTLSESITNDVGWTGVIVAWLAKLNPTGILIASVLISILRYGCQIANTNFSTIDSNFADLLQGLILFSILVADFLLRFRIVRVKNKEEVEK